MENDIVGKAVIFLLGTILLAAIAIVFSVAWNYGVAPTVDGIHEIGVLQALAIMAILVIVSPTKYKHGD